MNAKQVRDQVLELFNKRSGLMMLRQELAENFYPERADFTLRRTLGTDFASGLTTSYPLLCRRDLGEQFGTMQRPAGQEWFHVTVRGENEAKLDNESRAWIQDKESVMRRAMYDIVAGFKKASSQKDNDIACFGDAVLGIQVNRTRSNLLYQCHHTRDVVWIEDSDGQICLRARKWRPGAAELYRIFGDKNHAKVKEVADKRPFEEMEVLHVVIEADLYDGDAGGKPRWSLYIDARNGGQGGAPHVIEEIAIWGRIYRIPRWQTVASTIGGSQYGMSPAAIVALPEARLLQAMALTLLEAGEGIVNPALLATIDAVRSDIALYPGGVTWLDNEYDESRGEALRPLLKDTRGMPLSQDLNSDTRAIIKEAWYLNKLSLPRNEGDMTAYEVGQRVQEYIRGALPLFEPLESEDNGQTCEETWELLSRAGSFGSPWEMPKKLRGAPISFRFDSPLHDAIERQKAIRWVEAKQVVLDAAQLDRRAPAVLDALTGLREVLTGLRTPATWIRDEVQAQEVTDANDALAQAQAVLSATEQSSKIAANMGGAAADQAKAQSLQPA